MINLFLYYSKNFQKQFNIINFSNVWNIAYFRNEDYENYEVDENDLSPIFNFTKNKKQLTLVTCNNFNDKRIIIVATMK